MPYKIVPNDDGTFKVINELTGKVHAKRTSKSKAERQVRLMEAEEHNPGGLRRRRRYQ